MSATSSTPSNRISSLILFGTVAAAPLPFGSTGAAAIAFWCIFLGVALVFATPRPFRRGEIALLSLAAIVFAAYAFVLHEQLATRPWLALPHPVWRETADALGMAIEPSVSIVRNEPFFALGAPLAAMLAMICSFVVCADRSRARQLLKVIAWSGVAYAVFGIGSFLIDPTKLLWREKEAYRDVVTSTFVGRNAAAVYFGSGAVVWLLICAERIRRHLPPGPVKWRKIPNWLLSDTPRSVVVSLLMLFVCLVAMFMTNSRAGTVLSLMALVGAFTVFFYRDLPRGVGVAATLVSGVCLALILLQLIGGSVTSRFDTQGLADEGRFEAYRSSLRIIADHPWFGTGLGTFAWSFPPFRSSNISMWGVWDVAHDTVLEIATDLGLPLAAVVIVAWITVLVVLIRGVYVRRRDRMVPVAALFVAIIALLHSLIDFSLQIPGFSIEVFALVGAGLSQSFPSRNSSETGT